MCLTQPIELYARDPKTERRIWRALKDEEIPLYARDPETGRRIWRKNKYKQMDEELKDYEYFGGDEGHHHNYWKQQQKTYPDLQQPHHAIECYCEVPIEKNCYVYNNDTHDMVVVGSCCIKRFEKRRLCRTCKAPHSGTKYNQCLSCRKDEERAKKEQEKHQHEERRRFWQEQKEKQKQAEREWFNERETKRREIARKRREEEEERKKAEQQRFNDVWTNGTVRDKLNTYQLPKLHILAERKGILKYQRYEREALIDTLLNYTTHKDLPIR